MVVNVKHTHDDKQHKTVTLTLYKNETNTIHMYVDKFTVTIDKYLSFKTLVFVKYTCPLTMSHYIMYECLHNAS